MGPLAYIIAGIAFLGALAGLYGKVHHDGYEEGVQEVTAKWQAADKKAADLEAKRQADADLTAKTSAGLLAAAQQSADSYKAKWLNERKSHADSTLAGCSESPTAGATATAGAIPPPPTVRFSRGFLRSWDTAWTGNSGQPILGNSPADQSDPTYSPDTLTAIGPGEVLDNHAANADLCSADRRKLDSLIGQIEKLRDGWR